MTEREHDIVLCRFVGMLLVASVFVNGTALGIAFARNDKAHMAVFYLIVVGSSAGILWIREALRELRGRDTPSGE